MYQDEIYHAASRLLTRYGRVEVVNAVVLEHVYDDKKIRIVGTLDKNQEEYKYLFIALHVPGELDTSPFGIPSQTGKEITAVYFWRRTRQFYRPGRWPVYMRRLLEQAERESAEARKLDKVPVNDWKLFPDIALEGDEKSSN